MSANWQEYAPAIERHIIAARDTPDPITRKLHDKEVNRLFAEYYRRGGCILDEFKIWQRLGLLITPLDGTPVWWPE